MLNCVYNNIDNEEVNQKKRDQKKLNSICLLDEAQHKVFVDGHADIYSYRNKRTNQRVKIWRRK